MSTTDQIIKSRQSESEGMLSSTLFESAVQAFAAACSTIRQIDGGTVAKSIFDRAPQEAESPHEADRQIRRLVQFKTRKEGWDGRAAQAPNAESLGAAIKFLQSMKSLPFPVPMASVGSDGNAALYWQTGDLYADVELYEDGNIGYLLQLKGQPSEDDEVAMPDFGIPPSILQALIKSNPSKNR